MDWWDKMTIPMQKVWAKVSKKIGLRKTGLVELHKDVSRCEYKDVHILWEMLKRNDRDLSKNRNKGCWNCVPWAKCTPLFCRGV